jgi:type II secretory pathway component PulM
MIEFLIVLAVLALVVVFVTVPLRRSASANVEAPSRARSELAELEAARESKYREIRDAELDHRTGKLSDEDYQAIDSSLRAEALEILRALDRIKVTDGTGKRLPS